MLVVLLEAGLLVAIGGAVEAGHRWLILVLVAGAAAVALRAGAVGCRRAGDEVVVRSWLRTSRVPVAAVREVLCVPYSGFGNRFSESRMLSMVALDVTGRSLPLDLRFTADTPRRARARRAALAVALEVGRPNAVHRGRRTGAAGGPQDDLVSLHQALAEADARGVTTGWEEATPTWRTARLTVRRGDAEVVVFEDAGELVCMPPHHSHPHPLGYVDARRTAAALLGMVAQRP